MSKIKKIVLGLSVALTMAIAFVVGLVGLNQTKPVANSDINGEVQTSKVQKPTSYTYAPNQVEVVKGGDTLRFEYQPNGLTRDTSNVKAYEYMFGSNRDETMAVNLKYINTTDVAVSYVYSSTPLDTTQSITGETSFTLQTLENSGDKIYIYILVSPTNENIPASFTQDITWWFGKLGTMNITNPTTNENITTPVVKGQEIDEQLIKSTFNMEDSDYIGGYFYDEECTKPASNQIQTRPLYVEVANIPSDWFAYDSSKGCYYVKKGTSTLPTDLVIPSSFNDGANGVHKVTYMRARYTSSYDGVFYNQTSLTSVKLPSALNSIADGAFYGCSGLSSIDLSGCTSLTSISSEAFSGCSGLTSVDLSGCDKLTSIGDDAFRRCTGLTSISLPSSLTGIGKTAFSNCSGLSSMDLSGCTSLTSIGNNAFQNCSGLTSITLPSSLTSIGHGLLTNCSRVESIVVDTGNKVYDSRNNCNAIIQTSTNQLILGCKNTTILNDITSIGNRAFAGCSGLTSITIPSSVTSIGDNAFSYCNGLTTLTFASGGTWYYTSSTDYTGGTEFAIATDTNYATEFKSTYCSYYWYKV